MAGTTIYVAAIGIWLARALAKSVSFTVRLDTDGLGLRMPDAVSADPAVKAACAALGSASGRLTAAADALEKAVVSGSNSQLAAGLARLTDGLSSYFPAADSLRVRVNTLAVTIPDPAARLSVQTFAASMGRRMTDYLVISDLELRAPRLTYLLSLLGLIEWDAVDANPGDPLSRPHIKKVVRLGRLSGLIKDPAAHFSAVFGWGTPAFDPFRLFRAAADFYHVESSVEFGRVGADAFFQFGPIRWTRDGSVSPPALTLDIAKPMSPRGAGKRVSLNAEWGASMDSTLAFDGGLVAKLTPPNNLRLTPKGGKVAGGIDFTVTRNESARPITIIGGNGVISLKADDIAAGFKLVAGAASAGPVDVEPRAFCDIKGLVLKLGSDGRDSFLSSILSGADIEGRFDLGLEYRLKEGLVVRSSGGLEIALPMHQHLGAADFETLFLMLRPNADGSFTLETSAGVKGTLGPLTAVVDRIGAEFRITLPDGNARFGPMDVAPAFKPPTGIGLSLDAGIIRGGGFLNLDYDKGEYSGALELTFAEFLSLKAIGLISTRMPDGSKGFSLLVVITTEFGTPLQLSFGFTLNAVGGLLGLNRTMRLEELAAGVKNGAIESVMFPRDVIANAPQIISDLARFFPPEADTFLIGPMAKLGWGTPTLVSISLGVIIEVPPGNIAIVGIFKLALPHEDAALIVLQVNFIGALEVDKGRLWFFASLYESRILFVPIAGDMGLLIAWGGDAEFVISVGGFHPAFKPPPLPFPNPGRISVSILNQPFASIRVKGYFAVTSNTAQFGASVDIFFGISDFSVEGHIGFDALFQFSPFHFVITFSASMSVKVFGEGVFSVSIRGQLEGTSPWHIEGEGSISILFWDLDIPISHTWGNSANTVLPDVEVLPILRAEFAKRENWTALPPSGGRLSVSLRRIEPTQDLVLHPVGVLRVSQRAIPLDFAIQKIGNQPARDIERVAIRKPLAAGLNATDVRERFATGQFRNLDEATKLSSQSFEPQNAGIEITAGGSTVATSHAVKRIVFYELIVIDSNYKEHLIKFFAMTMRLFLHFLDKSSAARSRYSALEQRAKVPFNDKIVTNPNGFVVASAIDNSVGAGAQRFTSQAKAQDFLAAQIRKTPSALDSFHVIPEAEARMAA